MILVLFLFCFIVLILSIKYPHYYLLFYILATTKFLGFLDPASFVVGGVELGYFALNITAIFAIFFQKEWYIFNKRTMWFIVFIISMLLYGIIKPFLDDNSSLIHSLIASKETWFYAIFIYITVYEDKIDNSKLLSVIKLLGIYLSLVYILGSINKQVVPPLYYNGTYIRTFFPTYISLSLFIYTIKLKYDVVKSLYDRIIILTLFLGLVMASHLSLTIMSITGFVLYKYLYDKDLNLKTYTLTRFFVIIFFTLGIVFASVDDLYKEVTTSISEIISGEDTALSSRDVYNEFRWDAIEKKKKMGYGFIHQSSRFMSQIKMDKNNRFMERFTVIDSGYVDLLIKFGYIGTVVILIVFIFYYSQGFFKRYKNPLSLSMSIYLTQYVFINYTWSVYTFAHGIIPAVIAYHFLSTSLTIESIEDPTA